jgi:hypothetical protein
MVKYHGAHFSKARLLALVQPLVGSLEFYQVEPGEVRENSVVRKNKRGSLISQSHPASCCTHGMNISTCFQIFSSF